MNLWILEVWIFPWSCLQHRWKPFPLFPSWAISPFISRRAPWTELLWETERTRRQFQGQIIKLVHPTAIHSESEIFEAILRIKTNSLKRFMFSRAGTSMKCEAWSSTFKMSYWRVFRTPSWRFRRLLHWATELIVSFKGRAYQSEQLSSSWYQELVSTVDAPHDQISLLCDFEEDLEIQKVGLKSVALYSKYSDKDKNLPASWGSLSKRINSRSCG